MEIKSIPALRTSYWELPFMKGGKIGKGGGVEVGMVW